MQNVLLFADEVEDSDFVSEAAEAYTAVLDKLNTLGAAWLQRDEPALDIECLRNLFDYPGIRDYIQALHQQMLRLNHFYCEYKCSYRNSQDLNEAIRYGSTKRGGSWPRKLDNDKTYRDTAL